MLKPLNVLITRPNPQAKNLCERILTLGGEPLHVPVIEIESLANTRDCQAEMQYLSCYDWLIFTSRHAVDLSTPWLKQLNRHSNIAAIGKTTAKSLQNCGFSVLAPSTDWRSEGLLSLEPLRDVLGKKIALLQGENPRPKLAETLRVRGAVIKEIFIYRRRLSKLTPIPMPKLQEIDVILITSKEILINFHILMKKVWPGMYQIPLVVINAEMTILAKKIGFKTIFVAINPSDDAMITLLEEKKDWLCQSKALKKLSQKNVDLGRA